MIKKLTFIVGFLLCSLLTFGQRELDGNEYQSRLCTVFDSVGSPNSTRIKGDFKIKFIKKEGISFLFINQKGGPNLSSEIMVTQFFGSSIDVDNHSSRVMYLGADNRLDKEVMILLKYDAEKKLIGVGIYDYKGLIIFTISHKLPLPNAFKRDSPSGV